MDILFQSYIHRVFTIHRTIWFAYIRLNIKRRRHGYKRNCIDQGVRPGRRAKNDIPPHHHARKTLCFSKIPDTLFQLFNKLLSQRNMCFANIFCLPWERQCCTSLEAREDGDKRYLGNEVDSQRVDYDVTCLDKMHHEKLLFYISFCFWVRSRFCVPGYGFCFSF